MNKQNIKVDSPSEIRIDKFLHNKLNDSGYSREDIKKLIINGFVKVNNITTIKPSAKISKGDFVEISLSDKNSLELKPVKRELNIIYEDNYLVIINKPWNLTTHPAPSCKEPTLVHFLISKYPELKQMDKQRPGIVHRLDKDTSGLMVVALNNKTRELMIEKFKKREVKKKYLALVLGNLEPLCGEIKVFMDRDIYSRTKMRVYEDMGRESITRYKVIKRFEHLNISLVEAEILTGRTHQIRVHFSHLGAPILGDNLYTKGKKVEDNILKKLAKRQMLHSWKLCFSHPITLKNMSFTCSVPKDFLRILLYLVNKRPMVIGITGNVGCGKSKVSELLSKGKYPLWSADRAVEKLYQKGESGWEMIKRTFGIEFLDEEKGCVDKKKLFTAMTLDEGFREEVIKIIHPLVFYEMKQFIEKNKTKRMVILEVPLLIESGWREGDKGSIFDVVVGVFCKSSVRFKRLKEIRGWDEDKIKAMDLWQLPMREKLSKCDIIIDNSFSLEKLNKKVAKLDEILRKFRLKKVINTIEELSKKQIISISSLNLQNFKKC